MISGNNSFGNNMNNGGQQQEKRSWNVSRVYGKNPNDPSKIAFLNVGLYKSQYSTFTTLAIRHELGKDSKGRTQFETGLNKENPSTLLNTEFTAGLINLCDILIKNPSDVSKLNLVIDSGKSKLAIRGSESNIQLTVTNEVGTKTIAFDAVPVGFTNVFPFISAFKNALEIVQKKQLSAKLDPDEFGEENNDGDAPF